MALLKISSIETLYFDRIYALFGVSLEVEERQIFAVLGPDGGGEQVVGLGRPVRRRPRPLWWDEPSLGLAPQVARAVFDALLAISQTGTTILLVEQNARLALKGARPAAILGG